MGTKTESAVPSDRIDEPIVDAEVSIPTGTMPRSGRLRIPRSARAIVVLAHGCRGSRRSAQTRAVTDALEQAGFATLLVDLLSEAEVTDRRHVFDVAMLAGRLEAATRWLTDRDDLRGMDLGYYGTRTGAAAALWAAASPEAPVSAIVSRSGRPDLAIPRLHAVRAPTLLIVGGRDQVALGLNRDAARHLPCRHEIAVVPEATHVFAEPGAPEHAGQLATEWFIDHLALRDGDPAQDRSTT